LATQLAELVLHRRGEFDQLEWFLLNPECQLMVK
jgi:hypothetical protein